MGNFTENLNLGKRVLPPCIGETERSLKARFLEHRRPSSTSSEVSQHIHIESPGHYIDLEKVKILDREQRWFERGVKEAIYIRINQPTLNKDGGRYKLPNAYDPVLTSLPKVNNSRELGHSADESCSGNWKFQVRDSMCCDQKFNSSI